jgi:hypothetical protein
VEKTWRAGAGMRMKTFWPRKRLLNGWADSKPLFLLVTEDGLDSLTEILSGQINKVALRHYIDFFDFAGLRLDLAFRFFIKKIVSNVYPS